MFDEPSLGLIRPPPPNFLPQGEREFTAVVETSYQRSVNPLLRIFQLGGFILRDGASRLLPKPTLIGGQCTPKDICYFAGSRRLTRSVPTIVFPVNPPASTALR
jgi:hypothetical protein